MSWVKKLPSGKFQGGYRDVDGRAHTKAWPNKPAARLWAAEAELEARLGTVRRSRTTVGEWHAKWWPQWTVEATTRANAKSRLDRYVLPEWRNVALGDITTYRVQTWAHEMIGRGVAGKRRGCAYGCCRRCVRVRSSPICCRQTRA